MARFDLLWLQDPELAERAPKGGSAYMRSLFYDTALSANPHALRSLAELVGPDHVLFGSDYPFAPELATEDAGERSPSRMTVTAPEIDSWSSAPRP